MAEVVDGRAEERREQVRAMYAEFNARQMEAVLARLDPEVEWPNGWEGGYVHGREGVRDYWTRQWAAIDPKVEPVDIEETGPDQMAVKVHQVVHDGKGELLNDTLVRHVYRFRGTLIARMDIQAIDQ